MNTINITRAPAQSLPSVSRLKDEAKAKRDEAAAGGKKMGQNVALKELARKYGYKSWEALEAAARSNGPTVPAQSVVLYTIDGFDQHLIVNRKLVASSQIAMGDASLEDTAVNMAAALGVVLDRDGHMHDDEDTVDGEDRDASKVLLEFGLIDAPQDALVATHMDYVDVDSDLQESYKNAWEKGRNVTGYFTGQAPYLVYQLTVASEPNPDHSKGSIDCVIELFVEVHKDKAPSVSYSFFSCTEADGRIENYPVRYSDKAYDCAAKIVKELNDSGVEIAPEQLMRFGNTKAK